MRVKHLIEKLKDVDPELEVYVWDGIHECYFVATFAGVTDLLKMEDGERVYDADDEAVDFDAFIITC